MTPTLFGRIQTRLFVLGTVGVLWTILLGPFLLLFTEASLRDVYRRSFITLFLVAVIGTVVWEPIYHLLQQFRWEKDWPALLGFVTIVNEGIVVFPLSGAAAAPFLVHFVTTWLGAFLFVNGPMRVPFIRWRFAGGRLA
jgi:hypothetical protein